MTDGKGRVVGLDLGERRIGVAVTDGDRRIATSYSVINRCGDERRDHAQIAEVVTEVEATQVVVGLPLSMSGASGPAAKKTAEEIERLRERLDVPLDTVDERLTTVVAHSALASSGRSSRRRREVVDQVAAAMLLQTWVDRTRATGSWNG